MRDRASGGLILVLDENLSGHRIVQGLQERGIPAQPQTNFMERGLPDEDVLRILKKTPDAFLLSKDADFHRRPAVRAALEQHGIGAFVITAHKGKTAPQLVELVAAAWPHLVRFAAHHRRPFVAKILGDGKVVAT